MDKEWWQNGNVHVEILKRRLREGAGLTDIERKWVDWYELEDRQDG